MRRSSSHAKQHVNPSAPEAVDDLPGNPANDAAPPAPAAIKKFDFHGDQLDVVKLPDGDDVGVSLRRLCEALPLDPDSQAKRLAREAANGARWAVTVKMTGTGTDGKRYEMSILPRRSIPMFAATISLGSVREDLRAGIAEKLARYQDQCADVLADHFLGKRGVAPAPAPAVDANALVTTLLTTVTTAVNLALSEFRTELREQIGSVGAGISAWQADDLRRRVARVAHAMVFIGDRASMSAATSHIHKKLMAATGWGFRGSEIATMPACKLPLALACLKGLEMDLKHRFQQRGDDGPPEPEQNLLPGFGSPKT